MLHTIISSISIGHFFTPFPDNSLVHTDQQFYGKSRLTLKQRQQAQQLLWGGGLCNVGSRVSCVLLITFTSQVTKAVFSTDRAQSNKVKRDSMPNPLLTYYSTSF